MKRLYNYNSATMNCRMLTAKNEGQSKTFIDAVLDVLSHLFAVMV